MSLFHQILIVISYFLRSFALILEMNDRSKIEGNIQSEILIKEELKDDDQLDSQFVKDEAEDECTSMWIPDLSSELNCTEKNDINSNFTRNNEFVGEDSSRYADEKHLQSSFETIEHGNVSGEPIIYPYCQYKSKNSSFPRSRILSKHCKYKPFSCPFCNYRCNQTNNLKSHIAFKHSFEKPFHCNHCSYRSSQSSNLTRHVKLRHFKDKSQLKSAKKKTFVCPHCHYRCAQLSNLKSHITFKHSKIKLHACPFCIYKTPLSSNLRRHITLKHSLQRLNQKDFSSCSGIGEFGQSHLFNKQFLDSDSENGHSIANENNYANYDKPELMTSNSQAASFSNQKSFLSVSKQLLQIVSVPSDQNTDQSQNSSERDHSSSIPRKSSFDLVQNQIFGINATGQFSKHINNFPTNNEVQQHSSLPSSNIGEIYPQSLSSIDEPFQCPYYEQKCSQSVNLKSHIALMHSKNKPFSCPHCPYQSSMSSNLNRHVTLKHYDILSSFRQTDFKKQTSTNSGPDQPFNGLKPAYLADNIQNFQINEDCTLNGRSNSTLNIGNAVFPSNPLVDSSNKYDFVKSQNNSDIFDRKDTFSKHKMTPVNIDDTQSHSPYSHTLESNEKHFQCPYCNYKCSSSGNLKSHIAFKHTKIKPFCCPYCSYRSCVTSNVNRHIRLKHCGIDTFSNLREHEKTISNCASLQINESNDLCESSFLRPREEQRTERFSLNEALEPSCPENISTFTCIDPQSQSTGGQQWESNLIRPIPSIFNDDWGSCISLEKTHLEQKLFSESIMSDSKYRSLEPTFNKESKIHISLDKYNCGKEGFSKAQTLSKYSDEFSSLHSPPQINSETQVLCTPQCTTLPQDEELDISCSVILNQSMSSLNQISTLQNSCNEIKSLSCLDSSLSVDSQNLKSCSIKVENHISEFSSSDVIETSLEQQNIDSHQSNFSEKPYHCPHCKYQSSQSGNLKMHIAFRHSKVKPFGCPYCNYRSSQSSNVRRHLRLRHNPFHSIKTFVSNNINYQKITDNSNGKSGSLIESSQYNSGMNRPLVNSIQGVYAKNFVNDQSNSLTHEILNEDPISSFIPEVNESLISQPEEMKSESTSYESGNEEGKMNDLPPNMGNPLGTAYEDEIIKNNSKRRRSDYKRSCIRMYHCPHCEHKATQSSNLKTHIAFRHSKIMPFGCPFCNYRSSQSSNVKRHVRLRHQFDNCAGLSAPFFNHSNTEMPLRETDDSQNSLSQSPASQNPPVKPCFNIKECNNPYSDSVNYVKKEVSTTNSNEIIFSENESNQLKKMKSKVDDSTCSNNEQSNMLQTENFSIVKKCFEESSTSSLTNSTFESTDLKEKLYQCPYCDHKTLQPINLKTHIAFRHLKVKPFGCPYCNYRSAQSSNVKRHVRFRHQIDNFVGFSASSFSQSNNLNVFRDVEDSQNSASDSLQSQNLLSNPSFNLEKPFASIGESSSIIKKESNTTDSVEFVSSEPSASLSSQLDNVKGEPDDSSCSNNQQSVKFQNLENLSNIKYIDKNALSSVIEPSFEYSNLKDKPYQCPHCDHKTQQPNNLKTHIAFRHSKVKPFSCTYCHYRSSQSSNVKRHVRLKHSLELSAPVFRTYTAIQTAAHTDECSGSGTQIKTEMATPSQDDVYLLGENEMNVSRSVDSNLLCNEKQFSCPYCDHCCSQLSNLKLHISCKHSENKRFTCSQCNYKTSYSSNFKRHMILKHNNFHYK